VSLARADLLAYAQSAYAALAAEIGQEVTDSPAGYQYPIDYALRQLGVEQADLAAGTIEDGDEDTAFLLLDYAELTRASRALVIESADLRVGDVDEKKSQRLAAVNKLLDAVKKELGALGYLGGRMGLGRLNLDFLEPVGAGEF
jgi:hypothetical protein